MSKFENVFKMIRQLDYAIPGSLEVIEEGLTKQIKQCEANGIKTTSGDVHVKIGG